MWITAERRRKLYRQHIIMNQKPYDRDL